ncbi:MAG TPA: hypothetical protein VNT22_08590 [Baekduia sp.]|nr:hypothetical protein [Baekduia sp.]
MPRFSRVRAVPWLVLAELAWTLRKHWVQLPRGDREELARLLKKSKGAPQKLSARERADFKRIVMDLDLKSAALQMAPVGRKLRKRR